MDKNTQNDIFRYVDIEETWHFSSQQAKLSGFILKISRYEKEIMIGRRRPRRDLEANEEYEKEKLSPEEIRNSSLRRAKKKIFDLVLSNAWQWKNRKGKPYRPIFITFTFEENMQDLDFAHNEFTKLIKRLSYENWGLNVNVLKYLTVVEFQERGAIHYHVIFFNLPFMERIYDKMKAIWKHGNVWVESVRTEIGMAKYLCKYLTKSVEKDRLLARKSYFTSKGLKKPSIVRMDELVNVVKTMIPEDVKGWHYSYESEFLGHIDNMEYNLKKYPKVVESIHNEVINKYQL